MASIRANPLPHLDHLIYATLDLLVGIAEIERLTGLRATPGGSHPGRGTRNALLSLGRDSYLEIIAPDPHQPPPPMPRAFRLDELKQSQLVTWAAKAANLPVFAQTARDRDIDLGEVLPGGRQLPHGAALSWEFTSPDAWLGDGLIPFFIDWGNSPHPSQTAASGLTLVEFRAEHPNPAHIRRMLEQLGLELAVENGPAPLLIAELNSPQGRVVLR